MNEEIKHLAEAIEKSGCKMTFGLQPHHIQEIESTIARYNAIELNDPELELFKKDARFITDIWRDLGKKFAWEPLTLAVSYFEYLEEKESTSKQ